MSVVIEGYDKPKDCYVCPFDRHGCWCSITNGVIDRDDYSCDKPCPIKSVNSVLNKIKAEIEEQKQERCFDDNDMFVYRTGLDDALYIIDKYKKGEER